MVAEIIRLAELDQSKKIKVFLYRHALVEARHFLGLYRNRVKDKSGVKSCFRESISLVGFFEASAVLAMYFSLSNYCLNSYSTGPL